ncbi:Butirosin biosynthesis protein H, N-terminal [Streptomyces zhaozhouensis]|uniref:Butirosin biosynthesis protein H, N-terminal n=1 Tax=Streptomyces zhaozhouensis TaxID=1300267 RepID=A0A286DWG4_9ACTN|nr:BtrH N-terminal domain-containing protein [Streptomyces zhaozhouensis]SOD63027.1 Butirosin biosynthesis protein H, N-terminal [Streptomyces zhaozhouensis]
MSARVGVEARGGLHCETSTLGVLARHRGVGLSEPMLFGLGAGLSFVYWDAKAMDFPFLGGRVRPFEVTRVLAARLGWGLRVWETASPRRAWENVAGVLEAGDPVGLQLDSSRLEYFSSRVPFAGHVVALYGHDGRDAFLVDTGQQGGAVSTSLASLAEARAARGPMSARHRSFALDVPEGFSASPQRLRGAVLDAIVACAEAFLRPPIANLGCRGIEKAGRLAPGWWERAREPGCDLPLAASLMERGGTGGALFRNLYRDFLAECAEFVDDGALRAGHRGYAEAAVLWSEVAAALARAGETGDRGALVRAGAVLGEVARVEREAMGALRGLGG